MKSLLIILLVLFLSCPIMAQEETLYCGEIESGWHGGALFKIGAGATYRFVNGIDYNAGAPYRYVIGDDYENISDSDLSGVSVQIILKFGVF